MSSIKKEELKALADVSMLSFSDSEMMRQVDQVSAVLQYVDCLKETPFGKQASQNVKQSKCARYREDIICPFDENKILEAAPKRLDNFFVVPSIIKQ